jgi:hypothetical protein
MKELGANLIVTAFVNHTFGEYFYLFRQPISFVY